MSILSILRLFRSFRLDEFAILLGVCTLGEQKPSWAATAILLGLRLTNFRGLLRLDHTEDGTGFGPNQEQDLRSFIYGES